jgi:hypothetical protein
LEFEGNALYLHKEDYGNGIFKNAGHWILEEKPKETTDAPLNFLQKTCLDFYQ